MAYLRAFEYSWSDLSVNHVSGYRMLSMFLVLVVVFGSSLNFSF